MKKYLIIRNGKLRIVDIFHAGKKDVLIATLVKFDRWRVFGIAK